jgi:nickel/cobalt transporter (NicO) family protein
MSSWFFMGSALALGAAHALEPGHGKTLLSMHFSSATQIGQRLKQAAQIGFFITILHATSIVVYGLIGVSLANTLLKDTHQMMQTGGIIAGLLIMVIGLGWIWAAWQPLKADCHHEHDTGMKRPIILSLVSSLTPCPSAIGVVVAMVSLGGAARVTDAALFLLLFSMGLSTTLIICSTLLSIPASKLAHYWPQAGVTHFLRKTSAVAMVCLGGFIIYQACFVKELPDMIEPMLKGFNG